MAATLTNTEIVDPLGDPAVERWADAACGMARLSPQEWACVDSLGVTPTKNGFGDLRSEESLNLAFQGADAAAPPITEDSLADLARAPVTATLAARVARRSRAVNGHIEAVAAANPDCSALRLAAQTELFKSHHYIFPNSPTATFSALDNAAFAGVAPLDQVLPPPAVSAAFLEDARQKPDAVAAAWARATAAGPAADRLAPAAYPFELLHQNLQSSGLERNVAGAASVLVNPSDRTASVRAWQSTPLTSQPDALKASYAARNFNPKAWRWGLFGGLYRDADADAAPAGADSEEEHNAAALPLARVAPDATLPGISVELAQSPPPGLVFVTSMGRLSTCISWLYSFANKANCFRQSVACTFALPLMRVGVPSPLLNTFMPRAVTEAGAFENADDVDGALPIGRGFGLGMPVLKSMLGDAPRGFETSPTALVTKQRAMRTNVERVPDRTRRPANPFRNERSVLLPLALCAVPEVDVERLDVDITMEPARIAPTLAGALLA